MTETDDLEQQAYAAFDAGDLATAAGWFRQLLAGHPHAVDYHYMLGLAHKYLGEWAPSLASNLQAVACDDEFNEAAWWNAGIAATALGDWVQARRLLGFGRAPRIVPVGDVWHVGVLLIADAEVYATGEVLRARTEAPRGYTAEAQRERSERAAAAARGGFADGEVVHLGAEPLDLGALRRGEASGPLSVVAGVVHVRWSASGAPRPLADYLDEQLALR